MRGLNEQTPETGYQSITRHTPFTNTLTPKGGVGVSSQRVFGLREEKAHTGTGKSVQGKVQSKT